MQSALTPTLARIAGGEDLTMADMQAALDLVMAGEVSDAEIALLLSGLSLKGETVEEIAGAAASLRKHMTPIRTDRRGVIDTCGTGGDGSRTFNISTAAALVTAAAGAPVAKHGNRKITSRTGSADALRELGVNIEASVPQVEACLNELGICFCFAPLLHPAMKRVAHVRQQMGVPTIFNLLGPLTNPAAADFQLLGVGRAEIRRPLAEALELLGARRALVVHGRDGLDEVTLAETTDVCQVGDGPPREFSWRPEDFGLSVTPLTALVVDTPAESAGMIRAVLAGQAGPARDIVVLNAAAALWTAGRCETPREAAALAAEAIASGAAADLLARLVERSHRPA